MELTDEQWNVLEPLIPEPPLRLPEKRSALLTLFQSAVALPLAFGLQPCGAEAHLR